MGVYVDKARGEHPSRSVDPARRGLGPPRLYRRYSSVADGDIDKSRGASGPVYDSGATDQQVVHALPFSRIKVEGLVAFPSFGRVVGQIIAGDILSSSEALAGHQERLEQPISYLGQNASAIDANDACRPASQERAAILGWDNQRAVQLGVRSTGETTDPTLGKSSMWPNLGVDNGWTVGQTLCG
jgi:hypothetical protein